MQRGSRSSRGTTIREGTGEKNWYAIAAYVAFSIVCFGYIVWNIYQFGAGAAVGFVIITVFGVLALLGLATFVPLFKDSAYLRGTAAGWNPKWWFYSGGPILAVVVVYIATEAIGIETATTEVSGGVMSIFVLPVATAVSNAYYLYQRHRYVGVP